jgi:hypothetical protein
VTAAAPVFNDGDGMGCHAHPSPLPTRPPTAHAVLNCTVALSSGNSQSYTLPLTLSSDKKIARGKKKRRKLSATSQVSSSLMHTPSLPQQCPHVYSHERIVPSPHMKCRTHMVARRNLSSIQNPAVPSNPKFVDRGVGMHTNVPSTCLAHSLSPVVCAAAKPLLPLIRRKLTRKLLMATENRGRTRGYSNLPPRSYWTFVTPGSETMCRHRV